MYNQKLVTSGNISKISLSSKKKKIENLVTPPNPKTMLKKLHKEDTFEKFIDLTKAKKGGVPIDDVIASLKRLRK